MTAMEQTHSYQRPPLTEDAGGGMVYVNFDVEQYERTDGEADEAQTLYRYESVGVYKPLTYDRLVNAIVSHRYPHDKMQAVVNNHLLDPGDEATEAEYAEMQEWRKHAKEVAKAALETL